MSAKRPRPAIPVLVHVDNPTEAGSVTVDTSTIEGKMDTVINNQNRIYDKIPTSSGGSSADLTTVNANTTALAEAIGPVSSTYETGNLLGRVKNISRVVGDFNVPLTLTDTDLRSLLYNVREAIGYSSTSPTSSGTSIRNKLATIDTNTTTMKNMIGTNNSTTAETSLIGATRNLVASVGNFGTELNVNGSSVRSLLFNVREAIGASTSAPKTTGTKVRDLLLAIKENTASGGGGGSADLTTVNEKTTALATAIGSASDDSSTVSVIGLLKSITDKY